MESETFFSSVRLEIAQLCLLIEWRIQVLGSKIEPKQI
jgi:hypothetical protein